MPVVGILLPPFDDVSHAFVVAALGRDGLEGFLHNERNIVGYKCESIHGSHIDTAVPTVSIVHDMSDFIGVTHGCIDHSRSHDAGIVGLDLEVDVVGMGVIAPVSGCRRHDAVQDVVAGLQIGMPERISGICKCICK